MKHLLIAVGIAASSTGVRAENIGSKDEFKNENAVYNVSPAPICGSYGDLQKIIAFRDARQFELASQMKGCVFLTKMTELVPVSAIGSYRKVVWVLNGTPIDGWVSEYDFRPPHNWVDVCRRRGAVDGKACFIPG